MMRNLTDKHNNDVTRAVAALTTRFGHNETQAYAVVNETAPDQIEGLAAEVNRQANAFENTIFYLIYDNHISTNEAIDEVRFVLADIPLHPNDPQHKYPDRGHIRYLSRSNLNSTLLEHGLPANVTAELNAIPAERYKDEVKFVEFEAEALRLGTIANRERPILEAIKAKELKDYTIKLIMNEVGHNEKDATRIVNYIPVAQYNSITHHLQGRTGFTVRFKNYVDRMMDQIPGMTFEAARNGLWDYSQGFYETPGARNVTQQLSDNERATVRNFEDWQFALISEKTCADYQAKFVYQYSKNVTMPSCKPDVSMYGPAPFVSFHPRLHAINHKDLDQHYTASIVMATLTSISLIGFLLYYLKPRVCSMFGLFGKSKKLNQPKKPAVTADEEMMLHRA